MAGKGFDSEHGRVSEGGEEPSEAAAEESPEMKLGSPADKPAEAVVKTIEAEAAVAPADVETAETPVKVETVDAPAEAEPQAEAADPDSTAEENK